MKGFSLLEVMISSAVLTIGLTATVQTMSSAAVQMEHARHVTQALHVAETQLEVLLSNPSNIADPMLQIGDNVGPRYNSVGEPTTANNANETYYQTDWEVVNDRPLTLMKEITMKVSWDERGQRRDISLVTVRR